MIPFAAALAGLMALTPCYKDKADVRVPDYYMLLAHAVAAESRDADEAAALETIVHHEGGNCLRPQEKYTHSGAYSTFQLEGKRHLYPQPFIGLTYEPIRNATFAAADVWRHTHNCGHSFSDRMTVYAGRPCGTDWPTLKARANTYWYVRNIIVKEMRKIEHIQSQSMG